MLSLLNRSAGVIDYSVEQSIEILVQIDAHTVEKRAPVKHVHN